MKPTCKVCNALMQQGTSSKYWTCHCGTDLLYYVYSEGFYEQRIIYHQPEGAVKQILASVYNLFEINKHEVYFYESNNHAKRTAGLIDLSNTEELMSVIALHGWL